MSLLNLQLSNFNEIYIRLHKLYLANDKVIGLTKYIDNDTGHVAIYVEYIKKSYNRWLNYDISNFTKLSTSYEIYDKIRNTINFDVYKIGHI